MMLLLPGELLFKLNAHLFLKNGGGQIGHPAAEEIGDQTNQQITHRQWAKWQVQRCQTAGNAKINKQFARVDMGKRPFIEWQL